MTTCCKRGDSTRTWHFFSKFSMCRTCTTASQLMNVRSQRSQRHKSSTSTESATLRCARKSSLTYSRPTSIASSPMWTTCSSSRSSSRSTMRSTRSSPTFSIKWTSKSSHRSLSARPRGRSTYSRQTCAMLYTSTRRLLRLLAKVQNLTSRRLRLKFSEFLLSPSLTTLKALNSINLRPRRGSRRLTSTCLSVSHPTSSSLSARLVSRAFLQAF